MTSCPLFVNSRCHSGNHTGTTRLWNSRDGYPSRFLPTRCLS